MGKHNFEDEEVSKNFVFVEGFSRHANYNRNSRSHQSISIHKSSSTHKTEVGAHLPQEIQDYISIVHDHKDILAERIGFAMLEKVGLNEGSLPKIIKSDSFIVASGVKYIQAASTPGEKIERMIEVVGAFAAPTIANLGSLVYKLAAVGGFIRTVLTLKQCQDKWEEKL